jgi:hypothetical protein
VNNEQQGDDNDMQLTSYIVAYAEQTRRPILTRARKSKRFSADTLSKALPDDFYEYCGANLQVYSREAAGLEQPSSWISS